MASLTNVRLPLAGRGRRILPKTKIYAHAHPGRALRDRFTSQIGEIVWKYKLSPETVNLPARQGIHEIQVFSIALKTPVLATEVLRTIDRSIPSPLSFELMFSGPRALYCGLQATPAIRTLLFPS